MLHVENDKIKELLLKGTFGIEKENLRVLCDGTFSHEPDPLKESKYITRDFCENQVEINTSVRDSAEEAVEELIQHTAAVQKILAGMDEPELLWPFSNPPYISRESDIPIAQFKGNEKCKTLYREHLANRYGKYKMSLSGVHINYSFGEELLKEDFKLSSYDDFKEYKDDLYIQLAKKAAAYGWLLTALTAASPLMDSSFVERGIEGETIFTGLSSVRCSESGYWNFFTPIINYSDIDEYAASIRRYVEYGWLKADSEFYYPVRLKSKGETDFRRLGPDGVNHIELRMFDLNPLELSGINVKDVIFTQLFLIWLAGTGDMAFSVNDQIYALQNFKNAAHYDLLTIRIHMPDVFSGNAVEAALDILDSMKEFYRGFPVRIQEILDFEEEKIGNPNMRYAWMIRDRFEDDFVARGIKHAKNQQAKILEHKLFT